MFKIFEALYEKISSTEFISTSLSVVSPGLASFLPLRNYLRPVSMPMHHIIIIIFTSHMRDGRLGDDCQGPRECTRHPPCHYPTLHFRDTQRQTDIHESLLSASFRDDELPQQQCCSTSTRNPCRRCFLGLQ